MNILVLCPEENDRPFGGIRKLYQHVDILNRHGFSAAIFHEKIGFRCSWFSNNTKMIYPSELNHFLPDYVVIPEIYGTAIQQMAKGVKKVIFNQNCYYTFRDSSLDQNHLVSPYLDPEIVATLVVSEDSKHYLEYIFPKHPVYRIHNSINTSLFSYHPHKKQQIAFMPRKHRGDILQVINILKFRGLLKEYELVPIENKTESEVAEILKESLFFFSFGHPEGFSLPPAEAMACGCVVVGYHGMGGEEYFKKEFCYPIPYGDIVTFSRKVEELLQLQKVNPQTLTQKAEKASAFIKANYSEQIEEQDILSFWRNVTNLKQS